MWRFLVLVTSTVSCASAQSHRTSAHQDHSGHGWDIRLAVPGEPGNDYPTLGAIPRTSFSCAGKSPGYYADLETNCQAFRVCTLGSTYGFQSFLCPNGTLFNQAVFVCDWWMNVNCQTSPELFDNNNDKFGNLRLGPQLMKDVKKMLTHPMRNPYDKSAMKSNLIVMQDYRPPSGQLFPNEALIAGPERAPNNRYVPAKQVQINNQNHFNENDIAYAATTPDPRYLPAAFNSIQQSTLKDAELFARQRQNGQYFQNDRLQNSQVRQQVSNPSNTHSGQLFLDNYNTNLQFTRPSQSFNAHYGQKQISNTNPTQTTSVQYTTNTQNGQLNQPLPQNRNNGYPSRLVNGKQSEFSIAYTKQQYNAKQQQDKDAYIYRQPQLQFSNEINNKAGDEAKQNLNLVFSLLADSINVAKGYSNAQKDTVASSPVQSQFQNINNEELAQITNQISHLTSSQYSGNRNQDEYKSENVISTTRNTLNSERYQHGSSRDQYLQKQVEQIQTNQHNGNPSRGHNEFQSQLSQYQSGTQTNMQSNTNQPYSGQLYQLPVPDVTKQIYNQNINPLQINQGKSYSDVEIIKSESIPLPPSAKLEASPTSELNHFNSAENFSKLIKSNNGISAHLQDKIVGVIPHPLEDNKLVTYKKDESFYVYTKLDDTFGRNVQSNSNSAQINNSVRQQSSRLIQENNTPNIVAFQFIPSVSFQLEDEKEQQKLLNAFHIDENGIPQQKSNIIANTNQPVLTTDINYSVDHRLPTKEVNRPYDVNNLYAGPSSYSAPQASIGRLVNKQNFNSRLELDSNSKGYPRTIPLQQLTY